jgi:thioredoxin-related protein
VPTIIFWFVVAAVLIRVATGVFERRGREETVGLVRWHPSEKAAAEAAGAGQPILYDFTAAWCGPCHRLDEEGWNASSIAEIVNGSFVAVRVVDREREDGRNPGPVEDLERRYSVTAFPTLVVATNEGRMIGKLEGYSGVERLRGFLEASSGRPAR